MRKPFTFNLAKIDFTQKHLNGITAKIQNALLMPNDPSSRHLRDLPPRYIDLFTKTTILFGGFAQQFGWIFFTMGSLFSWVFVPMSDAKFWFEFNKDWQETKGKIVSVEPTNSYVNDTRVYQYFQSFEMGGQRYTGKSYTVEQRYNSGQEITILFNANNPNESYIKGSRRAEFPAFVLFVLLFPLIGMGFIVTSFLKNIKAIRLLEIGEFTRGKLVSKEVTNTKNNEQTVFKYAFEFEVGGRKQKATCKTHRCHLVEDEEKEIILYDRFNPEFNFVFDAMPNVPNITEAGMLASAPVWKVTNLLLPILGIGINVLFFWYKPALFG